MRIKEIQEDKIVFDNGTELSDYHESSCCEHVYADFKNLRDQVGIMNAQFANDLEKEIELVKDSGFRLRDCFVPCYDIQNGYYSGNLTLIIKYPKGKKVEIDIGSCTKQDYS